MRFIGSVLALTFLLSQSVRAAIIYDESISGDLNLSSETLVFSTGLNTVLGKFDNTGKFFESEAFRFEITEGLQLESAVLTINSIEIIRRFGLGDNFGRQLRISRRGGGSELLLPDTCGILAQCQLVTDGEIIQTPVQFVFNSLAPTLYATYTLPAREELYTFEHSTGGAYAIMDFRFDFVVGTVSSPPTLLLGSIAVFLLASSRKKSLDS